MQVQVQERDRPREQSCPLCRADLLPECARWSCDGCAVTLHADCAAELGRCPTLGCRTVPPARPGISPARVAPSGGPFRAAGHLVAMTEPPPEVPRGHRPVGLVLLGLLLLLLPPAVYWAWPAPPAPPALPAPALAPSRILAVVRLETPRCTAILEQESGLQLRALGKVWPICGDVHQDYQGLVPYPGRSGVQLLRFGASPESNDLVGVIGDQRLVLARSVRNGRPAVVRVGSWGPQGEEVRPPALTVTEWLALLRSQDPLEVLDALNWLGLRGTTPATRLDPDHLSHMERVRGDRELRQRVEDLSREGDPWIADAARSVLELPVPD